MKLNDLIRKKFMPPYGEKVGDAYSFTGIFGYKLLHDNSVGMGGYTAQLVWNDDSDEHLYPVAGESNEGFLCCSSEFDEEVEWFATSEEACEAAWENFDANYFEDVLHKEPG